MGIFDPYKPHVSKKEFSKKVRSALTSKHFSKVQRDKIEALFSGDMEEDAQHVGIDQHEIDTKIEWMKGNKHVHGLSDSKIEMLKQELYKHL